MVLSCEEVMRSIFMLRTRKDDDFRPDRLSGSL